MPSSNEADVLPAIAQSDRLGFKSSTTSAAAYILLDKLVDVSVLFDFWHGCW